ncbi:MAG TPA: AbrB family transcriptional regulator [Xanthobacteraceae bacterium]|nr:AbrB family transcriptional regulator [Xanthobacteraceae bacterium]
MVAPISRKQSTLRTAETLLIAAGGGFAFVLIGFPAGLISGSLLAVAAAALLGRPMMVPLPLARIVFVAVGISLGAAVTPELLQGMASFPVTLAALTVSTICIVVATTSYLRIVHGWDAQTAVFGASPGALAQVMALAAEYGADLRAIAIVQVMRVVLLTVGIPAGLALFGLSAAAIPRIAAGDASLGGLAVLIAVSTLAALAMLWLRLPGGLLFGAMIGSAVLHGGGFVHTNLPAWAVAAAVIGIGAVTGSRFANTDPRTLVRYLGAALGSFAVGIAVTSGFVLVLTAFLSVRIADAVVAFSPGAQDTMMVLALALHLDPIFVGAHHLWRFLLVTLSLPWQVRRAGGSLPALRLPEDQRPPDQRPTIED